MNQKEEKELGFKHYVLIGLGAIIAIILVIIAIYLVFWGPNWIRVPFWICVVIAIVVLLLALIGYWIVELWNNS